MPDFTAFYACLGTWLQDSEPLAVWIEAIALVAIFGLDWVLRRDQRADTEEQHKQTRDQLELLQRQVDALKRQEEAMQRPAVLFSATARPRQDAESSADGIAGVMVVLSPQG